MINVIASMVDTLDLVGRESSSIPLLHHLDHAVAVYMDPNRPLYINVTCMDDIHADWGSLST